MQHIVFILIAFIILYIIAHRMNNGSNVYKYIVDTGYDIYNKIAPYSFRDVRKKVQDLGQDYSPRQYLTQLMIFAVGSAVISYLYFHSIIISSIYVVAAISLIPYISFLRYKRIYSEFIFEQIQVYTTNVIMEFATTQSFVKSLEGVISSGVLEDPIRSDVQAMIDMSYANGTIEQSLEYMNSKYDFFIVRNMHQLFLQITNEGSKDSADSLENMSLDIDMLVENVYRDRIDRATFHKKFIQFGIILYFMIGLIQLLLEKEKYIQMLKNPLIQLLLHGIVLINSYFLVSGEKYYNEDVGGE